MKQLFFATNISWWPEMIMSFMPLVGGYNKYCTICMKILRARILSLFYKIPSFHIKFHSLWLSMWKIAQPYSIHILVIIYEEKSLICYIIYNDFVYRHLSYNWSRRMHGKSNLRCIFSLKKAIFSILNGGRHRKFQSWGYCFMLLVYNWPTLSLACISKYL